MRGVPRRAGAISRAPSASSSHAEDACAARSRIVARSSAVVVVEAGDEAEAVAQRAGDQPGARGGADEREARAGRGGSSAPTGPCRSRCRAGSPPSRDRAPLRPRAAGRWISSMNSTSPSSRLVRIAARSPARSSAGPLVGCMRAPISVGDDARRAWSCRGRAGRRTARGRRPGRAGAPRSSMISRCSRSRGWPTNSSSRRGRSVVSSAASDRIGRRAAAAPLSCAPIAGHRDPASTRSASRSRSSTVPSSASWPSTSRTSSGE